ncbi:HS12B-like protein [Mya arenaria]|uniref:HS12B-like protein n=1 Tax=Mya arenaria TaxID=6604 RepID=A0ABY7ETI6_MYAAR|nr:HS12B-like protein [Mya arenaria]
MATEKEEISMSKKILKNALPIVTKPEKEHLIVAAIDFGTTFTGYAFSTKKILDDKINCSLFRSEGFQSEKAPTCVLLNSDETFSAFGYDAEEKYEELCLNNESDGYHYFERFKMNLYKAKAEIRDDDIKLALEPEAASLYCNMQKLCKIVKFDGKVELDSFPVGHRYIVADLGGGTADLAVHEILDDQNLREIARSDGDAYGDAFEACSVSYNDTVREANAKYTGKAEIKRDMFKFSADIMKCFFDKAVDGIVKFIKELRSNDELSMIHTILMVGGFSESKYVQERIKNDIRGVRLVIPIDPSLAVLKGAVLYGKNPQAITERMARYSYGFSVARSFKEETDPEELKITINGMQYCKKVFKKLITKGEVLKKGEVFGNIMGHTVETNTVLSFMLSSLLPAVAKVYKSTKEDPKYTTTEEECEELGKLIIHPPPSGWPPVSVLIQGLIVGDSEMHSFACNVKTKQIYAAKFDCL